MPTWAIVLLAALGGGLLFMLIVYLALRYFLRKLLQNLTAGFVPVRIKTTPKTAEQPWYHAKAIGEARGFLESQGFRWVDDVALVPMEAVYASVLVDGDGFGAVVYDHQSLGVWVDVVAHYGDRGGMMVSSTSQGGQLNSPPFSERFYLPKSSPQDVWTLFAEKVRAVPEETRLRLTSANIIEQFEKAYADEIDWRNAQGGPSEDEVRRVLANTNPKASPTEEQIQQTVAAQKAQAETGLLEGLQERFKAVMTPQDGLRFRLEDLYFVHNQLSQESLVGFISAHVEDDGWEVMSLPDSCRSLSPLEAFASLQPLLPEVVRFEKVGSLDFPLDVHVYRPPQGRIPIDIFPHRRCPDDGEGEND